MANELIKREKVYDGVVLDAYIDTIVFENGKQGIREVFEHSGASAIVPICENGDIIFVKQYRHPAKKYMLEIPAGCIDEGETSLNCAIRELEEETGFKTTNMEFVSKYFVSAGYCTEEISLYIARNLQIGKINLDEDEFVTTETYTLEEAIKMIYNGTITDSKTMIGLLAYKDITAN